MNADSDDTPSRIDCESAAKALYDFLDGHMPSDGMEAVQRHVDTCRGCAEHFVFSQRVLSLLPGSLPLTEAPHALRARILDSLRAEGYGGDRGGN